MKIALSGPQGCGKTTVLNLFKEDKRLDYFKGQDDFVFIPEVVRNLVKKNGMRINENGTLETELSVLSAHIQNLLTIPSFITDRCIVDNTIYTKMSKDFEGKDEYLKINDFMIEKLIRKYDIIFYIPVEFKPSEDGVRNIKKDFYEKSISLFEKTYSDLLKKYNNIVILRGNREERVDTIFSELAKKIPRW